MIRLSFFLDFRANNSHKQGIIIYKLSILIHCTTLNPFIYSRLNLEKSNCNASLSQPYQPTNPISPTDNWCPPTQSSLYTHVHCFESTVTTGWKRGHSSWNSRATLSEPRSLGTGALFLISESSRGRGTQLLASRPDYMELAMQATTEWKRGHIWDILATGQPHSLGTGDKCLPTPCFRVLFGKEQQCSILRDQPTGDLKSHHL